MTNRTKTVHETAANKARTATNGVKAIVGHWCNCGCGGRIDALVERVAENRRNSESDCITLGKVHNRLADDVTKRIDDLSGCIEYAQRKIEVLEGSRNSDNTIQTACLETIGQQTKRIDALGEQVARVSTVAVHARDMSGRDRTAMDELRDKVQYYAWGTVMACVIALASLWVAIARG